MKRFYQHSLVTLQAIAILIGICCIGLSSYAFHHDQQWNKRIQIAKSNNSLTEHTLEILIRDSNNEKAFIGIVTILCIGTIIFIFIYTFCIEKITYIGTINNIIGNIVASLLLIIFGCLFIKSAIQYNTNYRKIYKADIHEDTDYFFCDLKNYQDYLELNDIQKDILKIEKVCQLWGYKYAAASLALLNSIIYLIIALLEFCLQKSSKHMEKSFINNSSAKPTEELLETEGILE